MKKYLKDLSRGEVKDLYNKNEKLYNALYDRRWDQNQALIEDEIFNYVWNDNERGYKYYDNYNSFFYELTSPEEFLNNLQKNATDREYFSDDFNKKLDEALKVLDEWDQMTYDEQYSDKGDEVYGKMEDMAKELLKSFEDVLHSYENISDEELIDEFYYLVEDELENDYTDGVNIYEHIDGRYVPSHEQLVY